MAEHAPGVCTRCGKPTSRKLYTKCKGCAQPAKAAAITPTHSLSAQGDHAETTRITDQHVRSLADLIRVCEIDTDEWTVERWVANKWEVGTRVEDTLISKPLFQIKAWLTRNAPVIDARQRIADMVRLAQRQIPSRPRVSQHRVSRASCLLELSIPDLHLGKLAWSKETGYANYDIKTAERLYLEAVDVLIQRTSAFKFDEVCLVIGNDFYHSDTMAGTTTKGTPLDNDSRYHKTFARGCELVIKATERARQVAPVRLVAVPGNHDQLSTFHLGHALECFYHKTKDVTVENGAIPRKYVRYGNTLLLFCHSDKGKRGNLPLLMATERSKDFGECRYREAHVGHTHETKLQEYMGVRVRVSPALCSPDAWHSENHFVGNIQGAEAFVWAKQDGLVASAYYTVGALDGD